MDFNATDALMRMFSGIGSFLVQDTSIIIARLILIVLGLFLAYMGFKR